MTAALAPDEFEEALRELAEHRPGVREIDLTRLGQRDRTGTPVEQLHSQFPFQRADMRGHPRLGPEGAACGGSESTVVNHGNEAGQPIHLHDVPFRRWPSGFTWT